MNITLLAQMRVLSRIGAFSLATLMCTASVHAAELPYASTPLFWAAGVIPNVALVLDTSGSMGTADAGARLTANSICDGTTALPAGSLTRMQAAKEAACQVALDNANGMRIGVFRFQNGGNGGQQDLAINSNTATAINAVITPMVAQNGTPLSSTMNVALGAYTNDASSPIQYRCQKNYVVFFTDGAPTTGIDRNATIAYPNLVSTQKSTWAGSVAQSNASSGGTGWDGFDDPLYNPDGQNVYPWLDDLAQFAYDVDMRTSSSSAVPLAACPAGGSSAVGEDCAGKNWDGDDDTGDNATAFAKQNVITYTLGFGPGANNGLLRNTPLVNQVPIDSDNVKVGPDTIILKDHKLVDGQFVHYIKTYHDQNRNTTATANTGTETLTATPSSANIATMTEGVELTYSDSGGTALEYVSGAIACGDIGGLTSGNNYYVASIGSNEFRLATSLQNALYCAAATDNTAAVDTNCININSTGVATTTHAFARAAVAAASPSRDLDSSRASRLNGTTWYERIQITNHGLNTGDLINYTCSNSCSATTQVIGGLSSGSNYYVASMGANAFRLATTLQNSIDCAAAADNTAAVGTYCIDITLPTSGTTKTHTYTRAAVTATTATLTADGSAPTPVDPTSLYRKLTFSAAHNLSTGNRVTYTCGVGANITSTRTTYYARNVNTTTGTFQLSLVPGGTPVNIEIAGNASQKFSWVQKVADGTIGGLYAYATDASPDATPSPGPVGATGTELAANGKYYVQVIDKDTIKLKQCGNTADCTTAAAGTVDILSTGGSPGSTVGALSTGPGRSYFSSTGAELSRQLTDAFKSISASTLSFSAVATSSEQYGTTKLYQAKFNTADWSGQIVALPIDDVTKDVLTTPSWYAHDTTVTPRHVPVVPPMTNRPVYTWDGSAGKLVDTVGNLTTTQKQSLNPAVLTATADQQKVLDWVLGKDDTTLTGSRTRANGVYGDILSGSPHFVGGPDKNYNASLVPVDAALASSYGSFKASMSSRPAMLYVGANDAMLHGLNADTGDEKMRFIPNGVFVDWVDAGDDGVRGAETYIPKFYELTRDDYGQIGLWPHRFFVDGEPNSGDAYFLGAKAGLPANSWHSVLVGGLGKGGRSIYALDITDPSTFDAGKVLWEFNDGNSGRMGYTYSKPVIARVKAAGVWAAIFGNGYDGAGDAGYLFVVNLETGALIKRMNAGGKGLSSVTVMQDNTDTAIRVYAGDLEGNIWKFDISDTNTSNWNNGTQFFQALDENGNPEPITSPITLGPVSPDVPSATCPIGGTCTMLYFGSGTYFQTIDKTYNAATANPKNYTFYALLDNNVLGTPSISSDKSELVEQTLSTYQSNGKTYRLSSTNAVPYASGSTIRGWYMPLVVNSVYEGERVVFEPVVAGKLVIFTTLVPAGADLCTTGGSSWLMAVQALDGQKAPDLRFDGNNDGLITIDDPITSGEQSETGLYTRALVKPRTETVTLADGSTSTQTLYDVYISSSGAGSSNVEASVVHKVIGEAPIITVAPPPPTSSSSYPNGRMSWRQLQ